VVMPNLSPKAPHHTKSSSKSVIFSQGNLHF